MGAHRFLPNYLAGSATPSYGPCCNNICNLQYTKLYEVTYLHFINLSYFVPSPTVWRFAHILIFVIWRDPPATNWYVFVPFLYCHLPLYYTICSPIFSSNFVLYLVSPICQNIHNVICLLMFTLYVISSLVHNTRIYIRIWRGYLLAHRINSYLFRK